jgi:hypothetical protein
MTRHSLALIDVFSKIPDFRQARGKRHQGLFILGKERRSSVE